MIKINGEIFEQNKFPDGTPLLKCNTFIDDGLDDYVSPFIKIEWYYDAETELINLFYLVSYLKTNYTNKINLYMPYVPNARMDRVKNDNEIFTLKYFCDFINSMNFNSVVVKNAHSNVSLALLNNVWEDSDSLKNDIMTTLNSIYDEYNSMPIFFYPDEGAMKRYSELFTEEYAFGMKKRDWETGKILGLDIVGDVKNRDILIIDDICSKGGTFYYSAKALKDAGARNIYLYITHCEHSIYEGEIFKSGLIEKVFTTDSIFRLDDNYKEENKKITII